VIDTENTAQPLRRSLELAEALGGQYIDLEGLEDSDNVSITLKRLAAY
jgi:Mg-chelatase subunit ChlD